MLDNQRSVAAGIWRILHHVPKFDTGNKGPCEQKRPCGSGGIFDTDQDWVSLVTDHDLPWVFI